MAILATASGIATLLAWPFIVGSGGFTAYDGYLKHVRKATPDANDDHGDSAPSQESQDSGVFGRLRRFLSNTTDDSLIGRMKNAHDSIKSFAEDISLHSSDDSL